MTRTDAERINDNLHSRLSAFDTELLIWLSEGKADAQKTAKRILAERGRTPKGKLKRDFYTNDKYEK